MLIKLIGVCLVLCGCSSSWTKADTYRHAALTGLMAVDMAQTLKIADNPEQYNEYNPILGSHPSRAEVLTYFGVSYGIITIAAIFLPAEIRPWLQYAVIGVESAAVSNNLAIGLGIGF